MGSLTQLYEPILLLKVYKVINQISIMYEPDRKLSTVMRYSNLQ